MSVPQPEAESAGPPRKEGQRLVEALAKEGVLSSKDLRLLVDPLRAAGLLAEADIATAKIHDETRQHLLMAMSSPAEPSGAAVQAPETLPAHQAWAEILRVYEKYPAEAIRRGRLDGVPEGHLQRFAWQAVGAAFAREDYAFAARFMQNIGIGTPEQQTSVARLAQRQEEEFQAELDRINDEKAEENVGLELDPGATMADFFRAFDALSEAQREIIIERIKRLPHPDLVEEIYGLREQPEQARVVLLCDLFKGVPKFEEHIGIEWIIEE